MSKEDHQLESQWLLATALLASLTLLALIALPFGGNRATAQTSTTLGVDVDPSGNVAASLGSRQSCISVATGDTFDVDIIVSNVVDLFAWELEFVYDPLIIEIVGRNVEMFLGSNLFQASEPLPDSDSHHFLSVADQGGAHSGSGVLARLTLIAKAPGLSPAALSTRVIWPWLKDADLNFIGGVDGNRSFDGAIFQAQIAVDTNCDSATPTEDTDTSNGGSGAGSDEQTDAGGDGETGVGLDQVLAILSDTIPTAAEGDGETGVGLDQVLAILSDTTPTGAEGVVQPVILDAEDARSAPDSSEDSPDSGDGSNPPPAGDPSSPPSSGAGSFPLWAIASIAAAVLMAATGLSVYLASRLSGRSSP